MRVTTSSVGFGAALAAVLAFATCKESTSNSCGSGTPPSLVGTYAMVSYSLGVNTIPVPPASGSLVFTATRYTATISYPNPSPPPTTATVVDSGTYAVTGTKCISQTSETGQPQFTGTFTLSSQAAGGTLSVEGMAGGVSASSVWTKQ